MLKTSTASLDEADIESFIEHGFVRLDDAFGRELARQACDELWAAMGLSPAEPEAWTRPVVRIGGMSSPPFIAAANTPRLHGAYDALVGAGRWIAPRGIGTFPIRFPSSEPPGDDGWHVDMSFGFDASDFMEWRVNIESRGRALLLLFLLSDVGPDDAPTRIRAGSHRTIAQKLWPHAEAGLSLRELSADGYESTASCKEVLATGGAGTVYLCHPFLVHAAQPHRGFSPRFMAQPPLAPRGELDPARPASPVEVAIHRARA
jgi:hypothetical protein